MSDSSRCGLVPQFFYMVFAEQLEKADLKWSSHGGFGHGFSTSERIVLVALHAAGFATKAAQVESYLGPYTYTLGTLRTRIKKLVDGGVVIRERGEMKLSDKYAQPVADVVAATCNKIGVRLEGIVWDYAQD